MHRAPHMRLGKGLARCWLWWTLRIDYHLRWKQQVDHTNWSHYKREWLQQMRFRHNLMRLRTEIAHIETGGTEAIPVVSWLDVPQNREPPYLCPHCLSVGSLRFEEVVHTLGDGEPLPIGSLSLYCVECTNRTYQRHRLVNGGTDGITSLTPTATRPDLYGTYTLVFTLPGMAPRESRRQVRMRGTHTLVHEAARVHRPGEHATVLHPPPHEVKTIMVDGVMLPEEHPLFRTLSAVIKEHETTR